MYMDNKVYDFLKWCAQYLLPGAATFYFAIGSIWGFSNTDNIVGSIIAVNTFVGAMVGVSNIEYSKSKLVEGDIPISSFNAGSNLVKVETRSFLDLSSETYDRLKWGVIILLPATGTLYLTFSSLWGFPYGNEIVGTVAAISAFLGTMLGISSYQYKKSLK